MIPIRKLRQLSQPKILLLGNHQGIIQPILDFDFLSGKNQPSVVGVVGVRQRFLRYFWGGQEALIPGFLTLDKLPRDLKKQTDLFVVALSGRRAAAASQEALQFLPNVLGGMIFAEGVPEQHMIKLRKTAVDMDRFVIGPASVGMVIGGACKLGAIGGVLPESIIDSGILKSGSVAVISTSGGMVNELINIIAANGSGISFAAAVGGERYPLTKPAELVRLALADSSTSNIVYFGEVGGRDEADIAELLKRTKRTKPLIAYIAGSFAERFETAPQFGHAKALAQDRSETASAKKNVLRAAGAVVPNSFLAFENKIARLPKLKPNPVLDEQISERLIAIRSRKDALFISRISSDKGGDVKLLRRPLLEFISGRSLSETALSLFLGHTPKSKKLSDFFDMCLRLLVDHGPQVSGAVNVMTTARAGKDVTASLASGILTIGPRFGGALNQAAQNWFAAVSQGLKPEEFVESNARSKTYIAGIGHRKYRIDNPDPRVKLLLDSFDIGGPYVAFAKQVASITTRKKAQLILNVDGTIAALLLDLLSSEEKYRQDQIEALLQTDFCNAIFVLARSVGFIAHHLEQQRLDEGLLRLPNDLISDV